MNGWKNYETWATYTWITNDEKPYMILRSTCSSAEALELIIKDWYIPPSVSLENELVTHALQQVDYQAIFEAIREE